MLLKKPLPNSMSALRIFDKKDKKRETKTHAAQEPKERGPQKVTINAGPQIVKPHITEKATELSKSNQYVFVVQPHADKRDVARSVEKMYGVNVKGVHIVVVHPKKMRLGRTKGMKKGYKKAIVRIQEGQKIEILPT